MATSCLIGIENEDKTVRYIYCRYDGYLAGVGQILSEHYDNSKAINKLLDLGDISSLGHIPKLIPYINALEGCTGLSISQSPAMVTNDAESFRKVKKLESCFFCYLFKDSTWYYAQRLGYLWSEYFPVNSIKSPITFEEKVEETKPAKRSKKKSVSEDIADTVTENPVVSEDLSDVASKDHEDHADVVLEDETLAVAVTETNDNGSEVSVEPSEETNTNE